MEEEIVIEGNKSCEHRWRVVSDDNGNIEFFYCIKCRRTIKQHLRC